MPEYKFKCKSCKKTTKSFFPFSMVINKKVDDNEPMEMCDKCGGSLSWSDVQIEFHGGINMNSSAVGVAKRKYSNKNGGPRPFVDGKFKPDMKPKW